MGLQDVTAKYVTVKVGADNHEIFVLERGRGAGLLCQHSPGAHNHQWRALLEDDEITADRRVLAYDLPGHGKSDVPAGSASGAALVVTTTARFYAELAAALADVLEVESPVLVAPSLGGNVALEAALRPANRFVGVIPIETADHPPAFYAQAWSEDDEVRRGVFRLMSPLSPASDRMSSCLLFGPAAVTRVGDSDFYTSALDLKRRLSSMSSFPCPVVMLAGDHPYPTTSREGRRYSAEIEALPGGRFIEMRGLGHLPMCEHYAAFRPYLRSALELIDAQVLMLAA